MDFERLGRAKLSAESRAALQCATDKITVALKHFDRRVDQAMSDPRISIKSARFLQRLWYDDCFDLPLSLGKRPVREALFKSCTKTLLRAADADPMLMLGKSRARMFTTCPDLGYHHVEDTTLNHASVSNHFASAMRSADVEGFGLIDIAQVHDADNETPDIIGLHFHGAVRSLDPTFKPRLAAKIASGVKRFNDYGLQVAKITYGGNQLTHEDVGGLAYYISKISSGTKVPIDGTTYSSQQRWTLKPALRALEAYSHFEALDSLRGIGEWGKGMRKACKEEFRAQLGVDRLPYGIHLNHGRLRRNWGKLYSELGFRVTVPFDVA